MINIYLAAAFLLLLIVWYPYSRIQKANLSWSPTWSKFCQFIASYPWFYSNFTLQNWNL